MPFQVYISGTAPSLELSDTVEYPKYQENYQRVGVGECILSY